MGCQEGSCGCQEKENDKVRVYFCPKCKSTDVKYTFGLENLYGLMPKRKCLKCGYEGQFPLLETTKKELAKKTKSKKLKKGKKKYE